MNQQLLQLARVALEDTKAVQGNHLALGMGNTETADEKLNALLDFMRRSIANQSVIIGLLVDQSS